MLKTVVTLGGGGGNGITSISSGTGIALTPDPITTTGTVALANTTVTAGTYGDSTNVSQIIIDAQGRITSAVNVAISGGGGTNGTVTNVATGVGLTGGPITTTGTIELANTAVVAGIYGNASEVSQVTIDSQGRITSASNVTIAISTANVSGLGTMATQNANNVNITGGTANALTLSNANISASTANTAAMPDPSLPLNPEGYITISINGTNKKIPYYGV